MSDPAPTNLKGNEGTPEGSLPFGLDDKREVEKCDEDDVEFLESREDAAKAFQSAEEPLDLVALLIEGAVVLPRLDPVGLGRHHRNHAQVEHQLAGLVALVGAVHQQEELFRHRAQLREQRPPLRRVVRVARREGEGYGRKSIRDNHINLGDPTAPGLADRLRPVFFNAPVPSGCTCTEVESSANASILMRTICSICSFSNTRSSTPFLAQRFIRT